MFLVDLDLEITLFLEIAAALIGLFQRFKLRCILRGNYLAGVVTFQNGYMIPLSRIQVYNNAFPVTPEYNRLMATASCPSPTTTSSGLYSMHALYYAADSVHNKPKPEYPFPAHHPTSNHLLAHLYHNVLLPILPSDDMLYDFPVSVIFTYISSRYTGRQHIYFSKIIVFYLCTIVQTFSKCTCIILGLF